MKKDCYTRCYERLENHPANKRTFTRRQIAAIFVILVVIYTIYWFFVCNQTHTVSVDLNAECVIPDMNPYDPSILQYILTPDPLNCNKTGDLVYTDGNGEVVFNKTALKIIGDVSCRYQMVIRGGDDDTVTLGEDVKYNVGDTIPADFFRMKCTDSNHKEVFSRYLKHVYKSSNKDQEILERTTDNTVKEKYNVLLFMVDSVSRLNCIRKLKKTYKFMTKTMGGYDMASYTKIGDNTFPNLIPMFTGKQITDLHDRKEFVDDYPFIWKDFKKSGYVTMFAEDSPRIGFLNWQAKGLKDPPTDHYMRPFMLQITAGSDGLWLALENSHVHLGQSSVMCYANTPKHKIIMDYSTEFFSKYKNTPRFDFNILSDVSHEHLNTVELCDDDLVDFLTNLNKSGVFENTFVFVFGDHGNRFDAIRSTVIGRLEERLPMMLFTIPELLKRRHPELDSIVRVNTNRLTTTHDVHQTLQDILHGTYDEQSRRKRLKSTKPYGYSFLQRIPKSRSCKSALIPDNYCACHKSEPVNVTSPDITIVAEYMVNKINSFLTEVPQCAFLRLKTIKNARKVIDVSEETKPKRWFSGFWGSKTADDLEKYVVTIETSPSGALFEATVGFRKSNKMAEINDDINRINKYGNQSVCVTNTRLKLYCFCK